MVEDPLKIIFISPFQFRLHRGIERFTYSLANALAEKGFSITVYTWAGAKAKVDWGKWNEGIRIRRVPGIRYFQSLAAGILYRLWTRVDDPDYIFLNFLYQGENRLPSGRKFIYILHSPASQIRNRYLYVESLLKKFANLEFVAVSQTVKQEAIPYIRDRRITVILSGVDTDLFRPVGNASTLVEKSFRIISAAALEERKGLQYLISVLGNMDENLRQGIRYDIFGEGPYKYHLQKLVREYSLENVVFINSPINNLYEILPQYDLFCLLSKGEAFAISILEAMACGLPILTSGYPPFNEIIDEIFGACIDPEDREGIIRFIENCQDEKLKKIRSVASRQKSMDFSWEKVAENYSDLLKSSSVSHRMDV